MAVHSTLMDFHVDPTLINRNAEEEDDDNESHPLQEQLEKALMDSHNLKAIHSCNIGDTGGFLTLLQGPKGSHATLRGYPKGLITFTLEEFIPSSEAAVFSPEVLNKIESKLKSVTKSIKKKRFPPIKRGGIVDPYSKTSDERLLEYDVDELLYEANSRYQNIKIVHTPSFGNLLMLDDLQNLAESDLIYTQTLMRHGIENYVGKSVLILGGGDGGLLHELLKENPAWVTMIEIDEMVMEACSKHLRSVCGNCLDTRKGPNYEIIVDDCVKVLEQYITKKKKYDYVIGDLTDIPITPSPQGEFWDFILKILDLSFRVLNVSGKFLTHGNGISSEEALKMYELQLENLYCPVEYKQHTAYVPSFMELWVFYEVWKKNDGSYTNGNAPPLV